MHMHMYLVVAAAVAMALLAGAGIAAVTAGWVVPWGRSRVVRPKLWGYGALLSAAGGTFFVFLGPLAGAYGPLPWLGWLALMAGLGLQMLAQRPGREATKTVV